MGTAQEAESLRQSREEREGLTRTTLSAVRAIASAGMHES